MNIPTNIQSPFLPRIMHKSYFPVVLVPQKYISLPESRKSFSISDLFQIVHLVVHSHLSHIDPSVSCRSRYSVLLRLNSSTTIFDIKMMFIWLAHWRNTELSIVYLSILVLEALRQGIERELSIIPDLYCRHASVLFDELESINLSQQKFDWNSFYLYLIN